jgi:hypothetical protein
MSTVTSPPGSTTRRLLALTVPVILAGVVAAAAGAAGASDARPAARPHLGILGDPSRFTQLTGQRSTVLHSFIGVHQPETISDLIAKLQPLPMLAIKTGGLSTASISRGRGDAFLFELNRAIAESGGVVYVRPMPEMNGHWNEYCAFNKDGSSRGPQFSTAAFRKAFARVAIIARGGSMAKVNASLRKLGLPGVRNVDLPRTRARMVWNPQGYGAPDTPANSAQAYYPGDAYVDVVANDLYLQSTGAAWDANEALYRAHPGKRYGIAEWGLWGIDDPSFVEQMATFVRTHPRTELLAYFNSKPGSIWDLGSKPRSRAAYRRHITPLGR